MQVLVLLIDISVRVHTHMRHTITNMDIIHYLSFVHTQKEYLWKYLFVFIHLQLTLFNIYYLKLRFHYILLEAYMVIQQHMYKQCYYIYAILYRKKSIQPSNV